jgi:hypothetical protein
MISADVEPSDIVTHDHDDVRRLGGRSAARAGGNARRESKTWNYSKYEGKDEEP